MTAAYAELLHARAQAGLAARISAALASAGIAHVAWKGNPRPERFEAGAGDLDLLVDRAQASLLPSVLAPFGFRAAMSSGIAALPGVTSYFAPHPVHGGLVHVHVHFRLLLGRAGHARFHLPIERAVLESSTWRSGLRVPSPPVQLILFVLHATLRHDWRAGPGQASWLEAAASTLIELERATDARDVRATLARLVPQVPPSLLVQCQASLMPDLPHSLRVDAAVRLQRALRGHRAPYLAPAWLRARRRLWSTLTSTALPASDARPAGGGVVIALAGADGAGKSTCAASLVTWLSPAFRVVHLHLGRPHRSLLTLVSGGALKVARALASAVSIKAARALLAHCELARTVCTARDRALERDRAGRQAARGLIVICERVPDSEHDPLAGTSESQGIARDAHSRLAEWMRARERECYRRMAPADLTIVLRLPPELAVQRKPEEPAEYVRHRASLVWNATWDRPGTRVVDASRPLTEVMRDLRTHVWQVL